ncbi:hypothetical protein DERP_010244 [Dermatophagoides pteronyssinus]|uniref:Uncharacterized protein n=1 Tax=Dermatophagoides pteronyssinus TaxID=6956 RepID=A0ABQ8J7M8_DERPT|nr:hypothetical protein DERP_010244 [Dermatophagoides pteronyssinus]
MIRNDKIKHQTIDYTLCQSNNVDTDILKIEMPLDQMKKFFNIFQMEIITPQHVIRVICLSSLSESSESSKQNNYKK